MRHKYHTRALVLSRTPLGESSTLVTLLTTDLGLVRARAQSLRKPSAKLASALVTFAESDVLLVKGNEGWRLAGAVLVENWFSRMTPSAHLRAARVSGLLLRLVAGESAGDTSLFPLMVGFFEALTTDTVEVQDAAECLAALRLLAALGLDAGEVPGGVPSAYEPALLSLVEQQRMAYITRINHGISVSGL